MINKWYYKTIVLNIGPRMRPPGSPARARLVRPAAARSVRPAAARSVPQPPARVCSEKQAPVRRRERLLHHMR